MVTKLIGKVKKKTNDVCHCQQRVLSVFLPLLFVDGEDTDAVIFYAFRLLDEAKNLIIENKEVTDDTNIRVNDHADNVMTLSYYANQASQLIIAS